VRQRLMSKPRRRRNRRRLWAVRVAPVVAATAVAIPLLMSGSGGTGPVPLAVLGARAGVVSAAPRGNGVPDGPPPGDVLVAQEVASRFADPGGFVAAAVINARAELTAAAQLRAAQAAASQPLPGPVTAAPTTATTVKHQTTSTTVKHQTTSTTVKHPTTSTTTRTVTKVATPRTTTPRTTTPKTTVATHPTAPVVTNPPVRSYSAAESEAIIRAVWPAALADQAVAIAARESGLNAGAHNWCCTGLFQIYGLANAQLIAALGYQQDQLADPEVNARVAYAMYQRSGWAPWS